MNNNPMALLMQLSKMGNNPQQIIQNLMMNNPNAQNIQNQMSAIQNQMKSNNMTPQQMAEQLAKQKGIDINQLVNMARNIGFKF